MDAANSILLNRFFTRNTFRQILDDGESKTYTAVIRRYVSDADSRTNGECISEIYQYLQKNYRNEYYYKNTLLNKLLLGGAHSPRTTTALTEVPVGKSKADFILINGKAVVYEIKTELDNFDRLEGQLEDYYKAFSRVVVVTSEDNYFEIDRKLKDTPTGIYILTKRGTLSRRKEPEEKLDSLSKSTMFKILRKAEYESVFSRLALPLPSVSQFEYYRACKAQFESLDMDIAYQYFVTELKKRARVEIDEYASIPLALKFLAYFLELSKNDYVKLYDFLRQ